MSEAGLRFLASYFLDAVSWFSHVIPFRVSCGKFK